MKTTSPVAATTNPGSSAGASEAPRPAAPDSTIITPPTIGPPKSAEMAENAPAAASKELSRSPSRRIGVTRRPTTIPSAMSGISGPRTAPNESVPTAASAIPGPCEIGGGFSPPSPTSGDTPPSPGRKRRATRTTQAPASGTPTTRYQGGDECPRGSGKSVQSQCSRSWTNARKRAATSAAGTPDQGSEPDELEICGAPEVRSSFGQAPRVYDRQRAEASHASIGIVETK